MEARRAAGGCPISALAAVTTIFAGLAGAVQVAVMARLGERVGIFGAFAFATALTAAGAGVILLAARQSLAGYATAARQPLWLWLGGATGIVIVLTITFAGARLGTAATVGIFIAAQLTMGALIDRFGLFGSDRIPLHWPRLVGLTLLLCGAALSLRK